MTRIVGIDEAGYGPNLGPFVMSMVTVRVPASDAEANLWERLAIAVRRAHAPDDERLVIDDSKRVHVPGNGLGPLERTLCGFLWGSGAAPCSLAEHWQAHCVTPFKHVVGEPWFEDGCKLPITDPPDDWRSARLRLEQLCRKTAVEFIGFRSVVVCPRQFNELVQQHDSKAAVPAWGLKQLLCELPHASAGAPIRVHVDKLGGRNHYAPLLQDIFPDHMVLCRCEGASRSAYRATGSTGSTGDVDICFEPEADQRHLPVALASMLSKYLREVLMEMFNRFWRQHVPGVKPTAGYPSDAKRFYEDIRPARKKLGISDDVLWRVR